MTRPITSQPALANGRGIKILLVILTALFLYIWLGGLQGAGTALRGYAPLHTIIEIFAVVVASAIFMIGWHGRLLHDTLRPLILACGFLAVALFDTAHLLSFAGMPDWITPSGNGKAIVFWFAARYTAILTLLVFILMPPNTKPTRNKVWSLMGFSLLSVAALCWIALRHAEWLPVFFIPEKGLTTIKISLEWLLVLLTLAAMLVIQFKHAALQYFEKRSLLAALWLACLSELCFTLYSHSADIFNLLGHVYKILSYLFLYHALVAGSIKLPYQLLTESRNLFRQLTDNLPQVFWMTTIDKQKVTYISPAYETIWQQSCKDLVANPNRWLDAVHPEDRARVEQSTKDQDLAANCITYRILRPDHSLRWVSNVSFPIKDEQGKVMHIGGVVEDITDKVLSEQQRQQDAERLRALLKTASDGIAILDESGTLIEASDSFLQERGYDASWIGRLKVWDWDTHIDADLIRNMIREILSTSGSALFETQHTRQDGSEFWVEIHTQGIEISGQKLVYTSSRDISERKASEATQEKLQNQLVQAQKMEAIGQLTGGIAHDFNNMLGAILGYAELLKVLTTSQASGTKQERYINEILVASNRAKELISQMMIFSRGTQDSENKELPSILLQPIIKEVVYLLRSSIPSSIAVNYAVGAEDLRARIQPVQLHQLILNLCINARDAIGDYGRIDILVQKKMVNGACHSCQKNFTGEFIELCVRDTGMGIPGDILKNIFDPFFTTKDVGKGTGMGLSVVHGIVHALGGHIQVESTPNLGTTLCILLPVEDQDTAQTIPPTLRTDSETQSKLTGLRIMLVDDEVAMTNMLHELLTLHGAPTFAFNSPAEALAAFERNPKQFDLVITDETMPELAGHDLARTMLAIRPDLPVILCTGYSENVDPEAARLHGIAGFLYKPVRAKDLIDLASKLTHRLP